MPSTFWGLVAKEAMQQGVSLRRMQYIVRNVLRCHRYSTITIADIFDYDCYIEEFSLRDLQTLQLPHESLAMIYFGNTWHIVWEKDAKDYGYPYKRIYSNAEREELEKRLDEQRHELELMNWKSEHPDEEIPEEVPDNLVEDLAEEFSVKNIMKKK